MNIDKIEEGDLVRVEWEHCMSIHEAIVLYTPCATGDSWRLKSKDDDKIYYVQNFSRMILLKKDTND